MTESTAPTQAGPPAEIVHARPADGEALTPCCGRTPFELPDHDRISNNPDSVNCTGNQPSAVLQQLRERMATADAAIAELVDLSGQGKFPITPAGLKGLEADARWEVLLDSLFGDHNSSDRLGYEITVRETFLQNVTRMLPKVAQHIEATRAEQRKSILLDGVPLGGGRYGGGRS